MFSRAFAMPSRDTFSVKPIGSFVERYLSHSKISIDPFARNFLGATYRNDLNPETAATYHYKSTEFLRLLKGQGVIADLAILDPPYSPRQISECYKGIGLSVSAKDTQNAALYSETRDALVDVLSDDAVVLSFGWNSNGMGKGRGFNLVELLLVSHGGAHNDTICIAERCARKSSEKP